MSFTTLNKFDAEGHPIKYDDYRTEQEAINRISELHAMGLTDAFYVDSDATASGSDKCFVRCNHWVADVEAKTIVLDRAALDAEVREEYMGDLRMDRNMLLVSSDWTQNTDSPLDDSDKASWTTYRQALRDLPANTDDPNNPTWPTPPE